MDIDGGVKRNLYDSMAEGVTGAGCVVCFMTEAYERSDNVRIGSQIVHLHSKSLQCSLVCKAYHA